MVPKKARLHIKPLAEKLNCSEDLVGDLMQFYYADVRKALSELKAPSITVEGLGRFLVKPWRLKEDLVKIQRSLKTMDVTVFKGYSQKTRLEIVEQEIIRVQKLVDKESLRKEQIKQKRNEAIAKTDLQASQTDSRGSQECNL